MTRFNPLDHPVCLSYPQWIAPSEWIEHVPFAMYVIDVLRPGVVVELGSHYGVSYCAFCQAVTELHLPTRCYAIDTWQGDPHDGFYGSDVFDALSAHHQPLYGGFSRLIQQSFDDAVAYFPDGTIDLLHIDGYHTYEAVKHDFETWQSKLSDRAVVLFHDINVRERDFGAWRAWEELSQQYPHFAFAHGHGLGVLAVGSSIPEGIQHLFTATPQEAQQLQQLFYQLGLRVRLHQQRDRIRHELTTQLQQKEHLWQKATHDVEMLTGWVRERDDMIGKAHTDREQFTRWIQERDSIIEALSTEVTRRDDQLATMQHELEARDAQVRTYESVVRELEAWKQITSSQLQSFEEAREHVAYQLQQGAEAQHNLHAIRNSLAWKIVHPIWRLRQRILPSQGVVARNGRRGRNALGILRREGAKGLMRHAQGWVRHRTGRAARVPATPASASDSDHDAYVTWIAATEPDMRALQQQRVAAHLLSFQPLISIVTPVYNPPPDILTEMIESVLQQTYGHWELILVNGSPTNQLSTDVLTRYASADSRIRVLPLHDNLGIVGNTNAGLEQVQGAFVAFVDHDDTLAPFALFEVAQALDQRSDTDMIYSDSDLLSLDGKRRFQPLFKPDWSPAIMLSANYATHLCVIRTDIIRLVGNLVAGTEGAQDWDLILRVSEVTDRIVHIPRVLYHWRESPLSTAIDISRKPYALSAQLRAIREHFQRKGMQADVFLDATGYIRATWNPSGKTLVSIIIPSRNLGLVRRCIDSIRTKTEYTHYDVTVIDTTPGGDIAAFYNRSSGSGVRVIRFTEPFNFSAVNNLAARQSAGNALLFLNDDTEALDAGWLTELVRWVEQEDVGIVGAKLLHEDGSIQHAGVAVGLGGFADHPFAGGPEGQQTMYGSTEWYRNMSAVTGACLMIRRDVFMAAGGFDEQLVLCGNDVELCLRVGRMGYQVIYTPFARMRHLESVTRGSSIPADDFLQSYRHYYPLLAHGDPFFNPNLSQWHKIPAVRRLDEPSALAFTRGYLGQLGIDVPVVDGSIATYEGTVDQDE